MNYKYFSGTNSFCLGGSMYRITSDQVCNNLYSQIEYNTKYASLSLILMNNKYFFRMKFTLFWSIKTI
jgi:hypothetical protein